MRTGVRSKPLRGTPWTPVPVQYLPPSACRVLYTIKTPALQLPLRHGCCHYTCALLYTRDAYILPHGRHVCYYTRTPRHDRSVHVRAPYTWAYPPPYAPYTAVRLTTSAQALVVMLQAPALYRSDIAPPPPHIRFLVFGTRPPGSNRKQKPWTSAFSPYVVASHSVSNRA